MEKKLIRLDTIDKVKRFTEMINQYVGDADLVSGRYRVDAKSVMGIFSLDLDNTLELTLHADKSAEFADRFEAFRV